MSDDIISCTNLALFLFGNLKNCNFQTFTRDNICETKNLHSFVILKAPLHLHSFTKYFRLTLVFM